MLFFSIIALSFSCRFCYKEKLECDLKFYFIIFFCSKVILFDFCLKVILFISVLVFSVIRSCYWEWLIFQKSDISCWLNINQTLLMSSLANPLLVNQFVFTQIRSVYFFVTLIISGLQCFMIFSIHFSWAFWLKHNILISINYTAYWVLYGTGFQMLKREENQRILKFMACRGSQLTSWQLIMEKKVFKLSFLTRLSVSF